MAYNPIPSNPFAVPGTAAGFLDIRKHGTSGPVVTVALPAYSGGGGTLTPVEGMAFAGQSNSNGLAPQKDLASGQKGPYSRVLIWDDDLNTEAPLEIGVNECGLKGGLTTTRRGYQNPPIPAELQNYYDGFGAENGFASAYMAGQSGIVRLFKKNVNHLTNTNSSSIALWQSTLFDAYAQEFNRYQAYLATQGRYLSVAYFEWNQGEAETGDTLVADLNALMSRFKTLFNNPALKILIVKTKGANNQYAAVGNAEVQYVAQEPAAVLVEVPGMTYLDDDVHTDTPSMQELGQITYSFTYGNGAGTNPALYSFKAGRLVATDASTWGSTIGSLVFTQTDAGKRATFGTNGATVNGGQVYQSNAPAIASLTQMSYLWKGTLTSNNAYQILWFQNQNTPGGVEVYWDCVGGLLYVQFCTSAGGDPTTNYQSYRAPYTGGALSVYLGANLQNGSAPVTFLVNGAVATKDEGQKGVLVNFANAPYLLFADSLTPTNGQVGTTNRFLVFNRLLTGAEQASYLA